MDLDLMLFRDDEKSLKLKESGLIVKVFDLEGQHDLEKLAATKICSDIIKKLFGLLFPPESESQEKKDKETFKFKNLNSCDPIIELKKLSEDFENSTENLIALKTTPTIEKFSNDKAKKIDASETVPIIDKQKSSEVFSDIIKIDTTFKDLLECKNEVTETCEEINPDCESNEDWKNQNTEADSLIDSKNDQIKQLKTHCKIEDFPKIEEPIVKTKMFEIIKLTQPRPSPLEISLLNIIELYPKFQINSHLLTLSKEKPIETITAKHKKIPGLLSISLVNHPEKFSLFTKKSISLLEIYKTEIVQVHSIIPKINIELIEISEEVDRSLEIKIEQFSNSKENIESFTLKSDPCQEEVCLSSTEIKSDLKQQAKTESQTSEKLILASSSKSELTQKSDSNAGSVILSSVSVQPQCSTRIIDSVHSSESKLSSSSSLIESSNTNSIGNLASTSQILQDSIICSEFFLLSNSAIQPTPANRDPDLNPESLQCQLVESESDDEFELI